MIASQLQDFKHTLRQNRSGFHVAVASGKGGVGKTTFALNLSVFQALQDQKVLLVDADPGLADLNILLGIHPQEHWGSVVTGERKLDDVIYHDAYGMDFLHGFSGVQDSRWMNASAVQFLVKELQAKWDLYQWLVYDVGAGLHEINLEFMQLADYTVIMLSPELTSLADAYGTIKTMVARNPKVAFGVVINEVQNEKQAQMVYRNLRKVSDQFLRVQFPLLGWLAYDAAVAKAQLQQVPLMSQQPDSLYCQAVAQIANQILHQMEGGYAV